MSGLYEKILNNTLNRKVFQISSNAYLVGGYLRDMLNTGVHSRDIDFVVLRGLGRTVNSVSDKLGGRVVHLRKEKISRVVLKDGRTLDFSLVNGKILDDLKSRDFTFNAMAWSPRDGLLDPFGGAADIRRGIVRCILRKNFIEDPLRLLRAYRFAAENSWKIEGRTRRFIRGLAGQIRKTAAERITLEFFKMLNSKDPSEALLMSLGDGVLTKIISLSYGKLHKNVKLLSSVSGNVNKIPEIHYFRFSRQGLSYQGLLRLELMLLGSDPDENHIALSRELYKRIILVNKCYSRYLHLGRLAKGDVFELYVESGEAAADLHFISRNTGYLRDYIRFLNISRKGILRASEIMDTMGIGAGPELGLIINDLKRMQFEGIIRRKTEALKWLRQGGKASDHV
jgi:tRNA nucleotidyltransferase/poly(A) polymerase